tara:strand:- start:515 stop:634 length:120 start_codon:yes stop_codon:yes gene_type:complete
MKFNNQEKAMAKAIFIFISAFSVGMFALVFIAWIVSFYL